MSLPVNNKQNLFNQLQLNGAKIRSFGVEKLGVFGSFITGNVTQQSDVDFLIEFAPSAKNYDNFMELSFFLESITQRNVEIVTPESLSKYIGPHILKNTEYAPI